MVASSWLIMLFMKMPPLPSEIFGSSRIKKNDRDITKQGCMAYAVQETRANDRCVPFWPSNLFVSFIKSSTFSSHTAKKHRITLISELFCIRKGVWVIMPGFGTFHHLKGQQLTLQLFTARCAWPHLPFPLISTGSPPDTNHHHDAAKPMKGSPLSSVGVDRSFVCPCFISWFNAWSHRAADSALPHSLQDWCLALSCCFSIPFCWRTPLWWAGHKIFYSSGTCYWI